MNKQRAVLSELNSKKGEEVSSIAKTPKLSNERSSAFSNATTVMLRKRLTDKESVKLF
jgi:hypothetical protein